MRATSWCLGLCIAASLSASGCGDDRGGRGDTGPGIEAPIPSAWNAGESFGYILFNHETKNPLSLMDGRCGLDAQFAEATAAGSLPFTDTEGACVLTDASDFTGVGPDPAPICAGVVAFAYAGSTQRVTVCPDSFTSPLEIDCGAAAATTDLRATSGPDEIDGDRVGALDIQVAAPEKPTIDTPQSQGEGTALWPEGELAVAWTSTNTEAVEIVVGATSGTGSQIRCLVADRGSFTVPARFVDPLRSETAFLEVAALRQVRAESDGIPTRATFRRSDAIWLFPR